MNGISISSSITKTNTGDHHRHKILLPTTIAKTGCLKEIRHGMRRTNRQMPVDLLFAVDFTRRSKAIDKRDKRDRGR